MKEVEDNRMIHISMFPNALKFEYITRVSVRIDRLPTETRFFSVNLDKSIKYSEVRALLEIHDMATDGFLLPHEAERMGREIFINRNDIERGMKKALERCIIVENNSFVGERDDLTEDFIVTRTCLGRNETFQLFVIERNENLSLEEKFDKFISSLTLKDNSALGRFNRLREVLSEGASNLSLPDFFKDNDYEMFKKLIHYGDNNK